MESLCDRGPDSGARLIEHDGDLALALPLFGRWYLLSPLSPGSQGRSLLCRGHRAVDLSGSSPVLASAAMELALDAGVDTNTSAAWVMRAGADADDLLAWLRTRIHIDL